jgi:hypothetical protein
MMDPEECRAKAHEALACGATALNPPLTMAWEAVAGQWTALAIQGDAHETWRRDFLDREPS